MSEGDTNLSPVTISLYSRWSRNVYGRETITSNHLGIARDIEMPEAFTQAICDVAEQPRANYDAMCERVREVAKRFDYNIRNWQQKRLLSSTML